MAIRNYVGARYVPKFADPVEWQKNTSYEAMVIVTYNNSSYTSKIPVPPTVGNPAENSKYWALTGNFNGAVSENSSKIADLTTRVGTLENYPYYFAPDETVTFGGVVTFSPTHD